MLSLPLGISLLVVLGGCGLGYAYAQVLRHRGITLEARLRVRDLPLIPLTLLAFVCLLVVSNVIGSRTSWTWHMPLILDYYYLPLFWALKLAFLSFALSAITLLALLTKARYRYWILTFAIIAVIAGEVQLRLAHGAYLGEVYDKRTPEGIILQSNAATCAAASCANIAAWFGLDNTEADMIAILNTTWEGTSPAQIVYGMRGLGLNARKVTSPLRNIDDITPPAVLLVDFANVPDGHAIAYMRRHDGMFEIWDPQSGPLERTADQIRATWRGHAIEVWNGQ